MRTERSADQTAGAGEPGAVTVAKRARRFWAVLTLAAGSLGCSDEVTGPEEASCLPETASVEGKVTVGASVVFDWSPRCPVALVLIEEGAHDKWLVSTGSANAITPPVTYGQVPAGATDSYGPEPLVAGQTYELILWRMMPDGSSALLTVKEFTR